MIGFILRYLKRRESDRLAKLEVAAVERAVKEAHERREKRVQDLRAAQEHLAELRARKACIEAERRTLGEYWVVFSGQKYTDVVSEIARFELREKHLNHDVMERI